MRAVLMEKGKLWVDEVTAPEPGPGEVLVKTRACGICGSDLHAAQHTEDFVRTSREAGGAFRLTTFDPVVLGHEFCAEIVDFGPATKRQLHSQQLVCSIPMLRRPDQDALPIGYSTLAPGGFGEYMVLSEELLVPVPAGAPADAAALTEPLAVGYHAVNKANLRGDETVMVVGCGPVGLAVITALKARKVEPIIAADYSVGRSRYAEQQGADIVYDPAVDNPYPDKAINQDNLVIFECVGVPGMLDSIILNAPSQTRIVVAGACLQTDHFRPLVAINKEISLQFVLGYNVEEFAQSLRNIADGVFDVAGLISHRIGLNDVASAFEDLKDPEHHAKVIIEPSR